MSPTIRCLVFAGLLLGLLAASSQAVHAEDDDRKSAKPAPLLPVDKSLWLNTSPLTWEQLRGKGVYLFFFHCDPDSSTDFPAHLTAAKQHALDPVIFVGVAMSSSPREAEAYLRSVGCTWPTLCDPAYSFCHQCDKALGPMEAGEPTTSETSISVDYVTNDGKIIEGWWTMPEVTITEALKQAAWTTSPKDIPEPVLPIWRAVEFRKFSEALPLLKKGLNAGTDDHKAAARKLQEVVLAEIELRVEEARADEQADKKWNAYRKTSRIMEEFRGYDIPKDLEPLQKKLARTSQVKAGLTAEKQLTIAAQGLTSPNLPMRKRAQIQLEKIAADFPETDLAERAQQLLAEPQTTPK